MDPDVTLAVLSGSSLRIEYAVVLFPAPVSPTIPSVSPFWRLKSMPFTA